MDRNVGIARRLLMGGQEARHVAYSHEPVITSNATAPGGTIQWAPRRLAQMPGPLAFLALGARAEHQFRAKQQAQKCHHSAMTHGSQLH